MQNWNQTWSAWAVSIVYRRDRAYTINLIFLTVLLAVINSFPHRVYIATIYISIYKTRTVWHHAIRPTQKLWCHIFGWLSNEIKSEPKRIAPTVADRQLVFELVLRVVSCGNKRDGATGSAEWGPGQTPCSHVAFAWRIFNTKAKQTNPIERQTQEQM